MTGRVTTTAAMEVPAKAGTAPSPVRGWIGWVSVIVIAAGWQLATRHGATTSMSPLDLALFRYCVPGIVLLPVLIRHGFIPRLPGWWLFPAILVGAGLPFGLVGMTGAMLAPAAHMGSLMPGTMPLFVALLAFLMMGERSRRLQIAGYVFILTGVLFVTGFSFGTDSTVLLGDGLFLCAGLLWALYTIAFRKSGLAPWHGTALVCFWSGVAVVPIWAMNDATRLHSAPLSDIAAQLAAQGLLAGILGLYCYGLTVRHLGAVKAGISGAAVPPLVALGGYVFLGEPLHAAVLAGAAAASLGILLAALPAGSVTERRVKA